MGYVPAEESLSPFIIKRSTFAQPVNTATIRDKKQKVLNH